MVLEQGKGFKHASFLTLVSQCRIHDLQNMFLQYFQYFQYSLFDLCEMRRTLWRIQSLCSYIVYTTPSKMHLNNLHCVIWNAKKQIQNALRKRRIIMHSHQTWLRNFANVAYISWNQSNLGNMNPSPKVGMSRTFQSGLDRWSAFESVGTSKSQHSKKPQRISRDQWIIMNHGLPELSWQRKCLQCVKSWAATTSCKSKSGRSKFWMLCTSCLSLTFKRCVYQTWIGM